MYRRAGIFTRTNTTTEDKSMAKSKPTKPESQETTATDVFPAAETGDQQVEATTTETVQTDNTTITATTTADAVQQDTTTTTEPVSNEPSWVDIVRQDGFEDVKDEADARDRVWRAYQQERQRIQELETRFKQLEPLVSYGQQYLEQQRSQQPPAQQPAKPAEQQPALWPDLPKVDTQQAQRYWDAERRDWKYGTPPEVRNNAERFQQVTTDWTNKLVYSPREALEPPIRAIAREEIKAAFKDAFGVEAAPEVQQRLDLNGEKAYVEKLLADNQEWMFEQDPRTGKMDYNRLSSLGNAFFEAVNESKELGITSEARQYYNAMRLVQPLLGQRQQQVASETAQSTAEQKRQQHLRRGAARSVPTRDGSIPTNPDARDRQNPHVNRAQELAAKLEQAGVFSVAE